MVRPDVNFRNLITFPLKFQMKSICFKIASINVASFSKACNTSSVLVLSINFISYRPVRFHMICQLLIAPVAGSRGSGVGGGEGEGVSLIFCVCSCICSNKYLYGFFRLFRLFRQVNLLKNQLMFPPQVIHYNSLITR